MDKSPSDSPILKFTPGRGGPKSCQPQGLHLGEQHPLQGGCKGAQARGQLVWPAAAGVPRAQLDTRSPQSPSCKGWRLSVSVGVVRPSTRDAQVCGNLVVSWREIPASLPHPPPAPLSPRHPPSRPQPPRGRSLGGRPPHPPTFQSHWRQTGGGGDARGIGGPLGAPSRASCLSFPTRRTLERAPGAKAPPSASQTLAEFKLSPAPAAGVRDGPRRAPRTVAAAAAARGRPPCSPCSPRSPPAACLPLPRSGPRASSLLI